MFNFITRNFPAVVFLGIWTFSLLMYKFNPYNYFVIHNSTAFLIFLAVFSAALGFIVSNLYLRKGHLCFFKETKKSRSIYFNVAYLIKILFVLSLGSLMGALWKLLILSEQAGGVAQYLSNPIIARQIVVESSGKISTGWNIVDSFANYLIDFNYFAVIIGAIIFQSGRYKLLAFLPLVLGLMISIITFQRYFFVNNFVLWLSSLIVLANLLDTKSKDRLLKEIVKIGLAIALVFIVFSFTIISVRFSFGNKSVNVEDISEKIVESNYTYFAGNVVALDNFYEWGDPKFYYGKSLFRDPLKWFARLGLWEEYDIQKSRSKFTSIGPTLFNTYSFIRRFYEDFGIYGVCFLAFLWTVICNYLFFSIAIKFSLLRLYFVAVTIFSLFFSFFDFALTNFMLFSYMATLIFLIENFIFKPQQLYWFQINTDIHNVINYFE